MIRQRGEFKFRQNLSKLKSKKSTLPTILGNMATNFFLDSFRKQGFTDTGFSPWAKRKGNTDPSRAILIGKRGGHLKKSIQLKLATWKKIILGSTGIKYAVYHNEGIGKQPQREFIGDSKTLERKLNKRIQLELNKIFTK